MGSDLKKIKKYYGEEMMHLCRELFPTILEEDGALLKIMESTFPHSRYLYDDIIKDDQVNTFKDFIYDKYSNPDDTKKKSETFKSPFELMDKAGYILYECHSEADIQKFSKYYASDEALCTFAGGRLNTSLVFFAVKKNVDDIKRENFPNPERQDEYGTSVISIQYRRGDRNTLSVKNRYNHTVDNPDATFSNNLDNIIEGLNDSFERTYNLSFTGSHEKFELTNYIRTVDGKYYKYNYEINGIYYGPDNAVIENFELVEKYQEREKYLIIDNVIIDLIDKKIYTHDHSDKYIEELNNITKIEVLKVPNSNRKTVTLIMNTGDKVVFEVNRYNRIIKLNDDYTKTISYAALAHSGYISQVVMSKAVECGDNFLLEDGAISKIEMPHVRHIGDNFLRMCTRINVLRFPEVETIGNYFMRINDVIKELYLPNVVTIGDYFMDLNRSVESLIMPNVKAVGSWFMASNNKVKTLEMPNLETADGNFFSYNRTIKKISLPSLTSVGNGFFYYSEAEELYVPNLTIIGDRFMYKNDIIREISLPSTIKIGHDFINCNQVIKQIYTPNLVIVGNNFLTFNKKIKSLDLPKLELCGDNFLKYNVVVSKVNMPKVQCIGIGFLMYNHVYNKDFLNFMEEVEATSGKKLVRKR